MVAEYAVLPHGDEVHTVRPVEVVHRSVTADLLGHSFQDLQL